MPVSQTFSHNYPSAFNLKWLQNGIKYLSTEVDPDIKETMTMNMERVLKLIKFG